MALARSYSLSIDMEESTSKLKPLCYDVFGVILQFLLPQDSLKIQYGITVAVFGMNPCSLFSMNFSKGNNAETLKKIKKRSGGDCCVS